MAIKKYVRGVREPKVVTAIDAENILGGAAGTVPYKVSAAATGYTAVGSAGQLLTSTGTGAPAWQSFGALTYTLRFVMVNSGAGTSVSTDGVTWTNRTGVGISPQAAAYGSGVILAVRASDTVSSISTDGITWTARTAGALPGGAQEALLYGNGLFILPSGQRMYRSTDGITWASSNILASSTPWMGGTQGANGFVVVGGNFNRTTVGAYSTDGVTWSNITMPSSEAWSGVAYGNGTYVAVGGWKNNDTSVGGLSTDGITWTTTTLPAVTSWTGVAYGAGRFVAVGQSTLFAHSTNGVTWTSISPATNSWYKISFDNGFFFAASGNRQAFSTDGLSWTYPIVANGTPSGAIVLPQASLTVGSLVSQISKAVTSTSYLVPAEASWINMNTLGACTVTLPAAGPFKNRVLTFRQSAAFAVDSSISNVVPLTSQTPGTSILSGAGKYAKLVSDGLNWIVMEAN